MAINLDPESQTQRIAGEKETRAKLLQFATAQGEECLFMYKQLMNKYDRLISNCTNERERNDLCDIAAMEVTNLLFGDKETKLIV